MTQTAIGKLRHLVDIEKSVDGVDGIGGVVKNWFLVVRTWARIEYAFKPSELFDDEADVVTSRAEYWIRLRYRKGLAPTMRVKSDGRIFDVLSVVDRDGRKEYLDLLCEEIQA